MMKLKRNQKGFTLIEVLLIVVILGIIAAIAIPRLMASKAEAQKESCKSNLANLNTAIEKYYFDNSAWPAAITAAAGLNSTYLPDGIPTCPKDGDAYTIDGTTHRASCPNAAADGHTISFAAGT
jgi:general secretion pathway protein G